MATSEPLVPNDLPKGSRQEVRQGMRRAGIPLAPRQPRTETPGSVPNPVAPPAMVSRSGGFDPVRLVADHTPGDFPFLSQQPQPAQSQTTPPDQPGSVFDALQGSANSQFAAAVMTRLQQRRR